MESGRVCFVPLKASRSSITLLSGALIASTNLKRDAGETEDSLRDWVQLEDVNGRMVFIWEGSPLQIQFHI